MGYKLAGYDVIGGCDIDPDMVKIYRHNHSPKFSYQMPVAELLNQDLPDELYNLDILDGSPPCSTFSTAGLREKAWDKKKQFREGQAEQVLDRLFFDFIDVAKKLQPKIVVSENVSGLIKGNAKGFVKEIFKAFDDAGYKTQLFLLNAAQMGVAQQRQRTFFVSQKKNAFKPLKVTVSNRFITAEKAFEGLPFDDRCDLTPLTLDRWKRCLPGSNFATILQGSGFSCVKLSKNKPSCTMTTRDVVFFHWEIPRNLNQKERARLQTFPDDYEYLDQKPSYVCGMSVPPFMMKSIASDIYNQLLKQ